MRILGALLVLLVLGHLSVNLVVGGGINAFDFDLVAGRYTNPFWQLWNLTILWLAMLHGANGRHTIIADYTVRPATRTTPTITLRLTTVTIISWAPSSSSLSIPARAGPTRRCCRRSARPKHRQAALASRVGHDGGLRTLGRTRRPKCRRSGLS